MLRILKHTGCMSYSMYRELWRQGGKHSRKSCTNLCNVCQHCQGKQGFASMQHNLTYPVTFQLGSTQTILNRQWVHVSVCNLSESNKRTTQQYEDTMDGSNRLDAADDSTVMRLSDYEEQLDSYEYPRYGKKKMSRGKKDSPEADLFVKKRFYNIGKAAKSAEISRLNQAREMGEMTDIEYETELKRLEEKENLNVAKIEPEKFKSRSALIRKAGGSVMTNTASSSLTRTESESIIRSLMREIESGDTNDLVPVDHTSDSIPESDNLPTTERGEPVTVPIPQLYHLAPLVNESTTLRNLVAVGVDLSRIEWQGYADQVLKLDFKREVKPLLVYLHDIGIPGDKVGHVLSKNASLLVTDLKHLQTRIRYLQSKKFTRSEIVDMIVKNPKFLRYSTVQLDQRLGNLQKQLWLTGNELRQFVSRGPKVITMHPGRIQNHIYLYQDEFGFTKREIKMMLLNYSSILKMELDYLNDNFHYLHNVMQIPHSALIDWPEAMRKGPNFIKDRHRFLESQGRAQYNPELPNYVSLKRLLATKDLEFSCEIAKASVVEYNAFLRTV